MKVVINNCYGGFNLSDEAIERCIELGMTCTYYESGNYADPTADFCDGGKKEFGVRYSIVDEYEKRNKVRTHPTILKVVKELGAKANGPYAKLKIIDIPFDSTEGWEVTEYDGMESIEEIHRSWG